MSWLLTCCQVVLSAVMVTAAAAKMLSPDDFVGALRLSHIPATGTRVLSVVVPAMEVVLSLALLSSSSESLPLLFAAAASLLGLFTLWMGWVQARRFHIRCGCFGTGVQEVGYRTILRNVALVIIAAIGALFAQRNAGVLPRDNVWAVFAATSACTAMMLLVALHRVLPRMLFSMEQYERRQAGIDA